MTTSTTNDGFQWYVLHTLSGQEQKVKDSIERRLKVAEVGDLIKQVLIPTEKVAEVKKGKRTTSTRKFYPGYLLVNMKLVDEKNNLLDRSWYFIRETPGIIGFIGGDRPVPLQPDEVESILAQIEERQEKVAPKVAFETGETVKINDGPFQNFTGVIEEVDPERGKLKISVSIFGRSTPVELEYWQVERA
ncbi:transcription termination/antitermination factor NusG [bacterium]|nr:transcription termination/antitermination factor NusG [bacterium]